MDHRNLVAGTPFSILHATDIIERGTLQHWIVLRDILRQLPEPVPYVLRFCEFGVGNVEAQFPEDYWFWLAYVEHRDAADRHDRDRCQPIQHVTGDGGAKRDPVAEEALRETCWRCLTHHAVRDFVDVAALFDRLGSERSTQAMYHFDDVYPENGSTESRLKQVLTALATAQPADLGGVNQGLVEPDPTWDAVRTTCQRAAISVFDSL